MPQPGRYVSALHAERFGSGEVKSANRLRAFDEQLVHQRRADIAAPSQLSGRHRLEQLRAIGDIPQHLEPAAVAEYSAHHLSVQVVEDGERPQQVAFVVVEHAEHLLGHVGHVLWMHHPQRRLEGHLVHALGEQGDSGGPTVCRSHDPIDLDDVDLEQAGEGRVVECQPGCGHHLCGALDLPPTQRQWRRRSRREHQPATLGDDPFDEADQVTRPLGFQQVCVVEQDQTSVDAALQRLTECCSSDASADDGQPVVSLRDRIQRNGLAEPCGTDEGHERRRSVDGAVDRRSRQRTSSGPGRRTIGCTIPHLIMIPRSTLTWAGRRRR